MNFEKFFPLRELSQHPNAPNRIRGCENDDSIRSKRLPIPAQGLLEILGMSRNIFLESNCEELRRRMLNL